MWFKKSYEQNYEQPNSSCQRHGILVTPHETNGVSAVWGTVYTHDVSVSVTRNYRAFVLSTRARSYGTLYFFPLSLFSQKSSGTIFDKAVFSASMSSSVQPVNPPWQITIFLPTSGKSLRRSSNFPGRYFSQ